MSLFKKPFRVADKYLKKKYIVNVRKGGDDLFIPIPGEITKAFGIQIGDVAVFEIIDNKSFSVRFIKNTMHSFVEKI